MRLKLLLVCKRPADFWGRHEATVRQSHKGFIDHSKAYCSIFYSIGQCCGPSRGLRPEPHECMIRCSMDGVYAMVLMFLQCDISFEICIRRLCCMSGNV